MITNTRLTALVVAAATFAVTALDGAQAGRHPTGINQVPPRPAGGIRPPPRPKPNPPCITAFVRCFAPPSPSPSEPPPDYPLGHRPTHPL
jgi:hypothetical protein